ncbi:Protein OVEREXPRESSOR OF CATIONIC PEROXIDASE 3 [Ananas comosus]|uniref:Protein OVEREXPRESSOR OF CATIONIC PEROXIDASE 3 n=1 Tax=Ananas comosus TaxID=4615 RepID=A0A199W161_ANACO|nr:Protein OVEREXPRESSOR OF CATIONIC PEROXIDASE 3 [Ananas comosus]
MASSASSFSFLSRVFPTHSLPRGGVGDSSVPRLFVGVSRPPPPLLRSPPPRSSAVAFSRRSGRRNSSSTTSKDPPTKHKITVPDDEEEDDIDDIDEDAFEALFNQLEEDLKNDNSADDDLDDEITEEDMARLEQELAEALGDGDYGDESSGDSLSGSDNLDNTDDCDEIEAPKLKNWQIRRLARALKIGKRKTSIKNLAAELGLDRALVLELLRDPPPYLLLMSASLPDEATQTHPEPETKPLEAPCSTVDEDPVTENKPEVKLPVYVMQTRWSAKKRLKKVQVETLERVYHRTKRPTNAMISSIVHVTNLPWKMVVKWFEDKRLKDGVPDHRVPFRRSMPETVSID